MQDATPHEGAGGVLEYPIPISPKWIPRVLAVVVAVLVAAHLAIFIYNYRVHEVPYFLTALFDLDEEQSIPTWYSSFALLLAAGLLLGIAGRKRRAGERDVRLWYGLAFGFGAMSFDEVAGVHETLHTMIESEWTKPALVLVAAIAFVYLRFLFRLPARTRWLFMLGGAIFVTGALGVETVTTEMFGAVGSVDTLRYKLLVALEEGFEMSGVVIFIAALLGYMSPGRERLRAVLEIAIPPPVTPPSPPGARAG